MARAAVFLGLGLAPFGCSSHPSTDAGDTGLPDSGGVETGSLDSSPAESGTHDSAADDSGGAASPLLLVAAGSEGSAQPTMGFVYDVVTDTWSQGTTLGDTTSGGVDGLHGAVRMTFTDANAALAVLTEASDTSDPSGASGPVQFATWSSGTWTPFATIAAAVTASSPPSLGIGTASALLAFAGDNTHGESSASFTSAAWSPVTKIGTSTGGPPSIAARGADATVAYVRSSDGALVAVDRTAGTWGSDQVIESGSAGAPPNPAFAPSLAALDGTGPELVIVYTDSNATDLHFATRTLGKWSSVHSFNLPTMVINPDPINDGGDSPSSSFATPILALPGGQAVIAFTSSSQHVYTSQFDGTTWSTATSVFTPWCLDCLDAAQVGLASGVGSARVEVVFGGDPTSQNQYVPYHTRLIAGQWTAPKPVVATIPGLFAAYALASL
jgi:hypothetical protein